MEVAGCWGQDVPGQGEGWDAEGETLTQRALSAKKGFSFSRPSIFLEVEV